MTNPAKNKRTISKALVLLTGVLVSSTSIAQTESFPSRAIKTIVPLQAGSAGDALIRIVAQKMAENIGQPMVIDNQPGVSGALGAASLARATPDGYTLGAMSDSVVNYAPNLVKVNFDPLNDFDPISLISDVSWVLVVNPNVPADSVAELISWVKGQPKGKVDYASAGVGSPHQVVMELFNSATGLSTTHVPYKGATAALVDVVGGTVPMMFTGISVALPFLQDKKLKALAVPAEQRFPLLPDTPTMAQAGVPNFTFATWLGLYAPRGTPSSILDRMNAEVAKALEDPKVKQQLLEMGSTPSHTSREQLGEITKNGLKKVSEVVKSAGIPTNQ